MFSEDVCDVWCVRLFMDAINGEPTSWNMWRRQASAVPVWPSHTGMVCENMQGFGAKLRKLPGQAKICTPPGGDVIAKICNTSSQRAIGRTGLLSIEAQSPLSSFGLPARCGPVSDCEFLEL